MKQKVVIISGASSGIGLALAEKFLAEGSVVVINGRDERKLQQAAIKLNDISATVKAIPGDVSNIKDCERIVSETAALFGKIDVVICNAGISMRGLFEETDLQVLHQCMNINFWGTVNLCKAALPHLLLSGGSIIGISSIAGKKGLPARTGYSASKFAMEGFLETLRTENLNNGIHVLVACPGFTKSNIRNVALSADGTKQGESPRNEEDMMSAESVASAIYWATIKRKRDLILTFSGKLTLWLNKFFPWMMDKMVYSHMKKEPGSPLK
ncbi:MAG: hypothetical protein RIQ89_1587 [Bacteroidota bacterium]|jgi:dehydrogenase/reductase SDR family member 7B